MNQFVVQSALEKARQVIESERLIRLTEEDAKAFFASLERPPVPTEAMRAAAQRHKELFAGAEG